MKMRCPVCMMLYVSWRFANCAGFGIAQVLSGVALLSYRAAKAPRDKEHPYG